MAIPTDQQRRLQSVVLILHWLTLALGTFLSFLADGAVTATYAATAAGGVYVLMATATPPMVAARPLVRELTAVAGSLLTMTAVGLTGDAGSPFLLLALTPMLYTASAGGFRLGLATAALSSGILSTLVIPKADLEWATLVEWTVVFFLVAVTFGYAHRLLVEQGQWTNALVAASAENTLRLERLETANQLLSRLAEQAASAELNPMQVGSMALESARRVVPFDAATVSLSTENGPVAVARIGELDTSLKRAVVPLQVGEREVGMLAVARSRDFTDRQLESLEAALQPASLAFANILLLQSIAREAIREERTRLARDLHDDIGPSLASLGLALDLASLQHPTEPALAAHLQELRSSVEALVGDVRAAVADLREPTDTETLREAVSEIVRERTADQPTVLFGVHERRNPRPSIAPDVNAVVTEALRNAMQHSGASKIEVNGVVDFDSGTIEIVDNGRGFNPGETPDHRYGLVGIRERCERIGAALSIASSEVGTTVSVRWG